MAFLFFLEGVSAIEKNFYGNSDNFLRMMVVEFVLE